MSFKKFIVNQAHRFGVKLSRIGPYGVFDFESFLYRHLAVRGKLNFVQIGANDGIMNDPLYRFNHDNKDKVSGFVLEPLPDFFEKLKQNYAYIPSVRPVNIAIHATEKEMVMHRVDPTYLPSQHAFAAGIASFNSEHFKKTQSLPREAMQQVRVKCMSFAEFVKANQIKELDLLLTDTEGYDAEILYSIDFSGFKPKIIRFEHGVRDEVMTGDAFLKLCKHLNSFGYQIIAESYDATAYLLDPKDLIF